MHARQRFLEKVRRAIARHRMIALGDTVLVGFSGGPDSSALLHALCGLRDDLRFQIVVAHLDHAQRPGSGKDLLYCRRVARRLGLPVVTERLRARRMNEEELREQRYVFYSATAAQVSAASVATGHTADDRVETFLMHLLRGSGSQGLGSIPAVSEHHGVRVIRPLRDTRRAEVIAFLAQSRHKYLEDPTNLDTRHDRNRMRHRLLPFLEDLRPGSVEAIARASEALGEEADYLRALAAGYLHRRAPAGGPIAGLPDAPRALARHVVREAIRAARGSLSGVTLAMVDGILDLIEKAADDGRHRHAPITGSWVAVATRDGLSLSPGRRGRPERPIKPRKTRHGA